MGDIIGDWREEVLLAKQDDNGCTGLVGYTTAMPTSYSIYCLQQDPHYRGDCTTRGYYQHPNTGFYLGGDMPMPPLPPVFEADLRWKGSSTVDQFGLGVTVDDGFTTFDMKQNANYADGKSLIFDISGDNSKRIITDQPLNAPVIYLMNPLGHDYEIISQHMWGTDALVTTGTGTLIKSMQGKVFMAGYLRHTGPTIISEGTLQVNGEIKGPVELRAKGTLAGNMTLKDTITFEGALNHEGCRLLPGSGNDPDGKIVSEKSVTLPGNVYLEITAGSISFGTNRYHQCCGLTVEGDLTFKGTNYITVNLVSQNVADYVIAECTGKLTCDVSQLKTRGLEGINYDFEVVDGKQLVLKIHDTRPPAEDVVWTGSESGVWDYKSQNFQTNAPTTFVSGDAVVFNNQASQKTITLNDMMVTKGVVFDSGKYALSGEGGISGAGGITVNRDADVTLNMKYSDYTGATIVNGGKLTVPNFYDGGQKSALGAAADKGNLVLNGGTLVLSKDNMGTDRQITLADTATITIEQANSSLSLKGAVSGTGYLVKDGAGQLNFTYPGTNNFAGVIVKKGIVAQGVWNSTFGRSGTPMLLAGGEVHQIDINNTSAVPVFNHVVTIQEGTANKIVGSSRGKLNGSVKGKGDLTIETRYVRCDVGFDFKDFEGTLTAKADGGQFRLMSNVTDISKARLVIDAGTTVAHYASGSGNAATATLKIGSLQSKAADAVLGGSSSSYQVGFLNEDCSFSGLLQAARVTKTGTGVLTLRSAGHTSPVTVGGGTLELSHTGAEVMTSGTITVNNGGTLRGSGMAQQVVVNKGGIIMGGITDAGVGKLRIGGNLTLNSGSTLLCKLSATSNSLIEVTGSIAHQGDTIMLYIPAERALQEGDEIRVVTAASQTGEFVLKVVSEGDIYEFDTSALLSSGTLRVTSAISVIRDIFASDAPIDLYGADGRKLRSATPYRQAIDGLSVGVYIVGRPNGRTYKLRIGN